MLRNKLRYGSKYQKSKAEMKQVIFARGGGLADREVWVRRLVLFISFFYVVLYYLIATMCLYFVVTF